MSTSKTRDESQLIDAMGRYADGDARAFDEVYRVLSPVVLRCQIRWVGDRTLAEDLTQQTFLRVHKARDRYRPGAPVGPWVLTIARRLSIDALRKRGSRKDVLTREGELPEMQTAPEEEETPTELIEALKQAINELPEGQRAVVAMHKLEGRPLAEVAATLGIKEGAARVRAHRGYNRLRARLAGMLQRGRE
ncbi:MAG: RNA polymerase sigma factor [Bradymonadia bacterium]